MNPSSGAGAPEVEVHESPMRRWFFRFGLAAALAFAAVTAPGAAQAEPNQRERITARALFDDARKLMAKRKYDEACPKLEESQRLDPGIGTQFNLADCLEHLGKTASAWSNFLDVASAAKAAGQAARADVARTRAAALEPKIARLTITVTSPSPSLVLKNDGVVVERPIWGTPIPIDAGTHVLTATAPAKKPWEGTVVTKDDGAVATVSVPALEALPEGAADAESSSGAPGEAPAPGSPRRTSPTSPKPRNRTPPVSAIMLQSAGAAGLVMSGVFAGLAKSAYNESIRHCLPGSHNDCYDPGVELRGRALAFGDGATAAFIVGGAALAAGAVLWIALPSSHDEAARGGPPRRFGASVTVGPGQAGLRVKGSF
jgi:tetratricopeptide (TPR) repeat protein